MESAGPGGLIGGRYRLGAVIGRGGMGVVWQARDELLSRDVAVKELVWPAHFSAADQQAACRRATREAKLAARLNHRNVIRVFDIIEEDGCPWIVTELLSHGSLRDLVKKEGPLDSARAAEVGLGILAALRAAHAEGIVHRDVKPANILVAPDRVVLTDFGIARDAGTSALTTVGVLIGSPSYMAPERARGGQSGPAADLWGLGASLYAAVEGHGPFDRAGGALASLTAVVADEPAPAAHAGPLLWPVISGLLRKDPGERLNAAEAERMLRPASVPDVPLAPLAPVSAGASRPRPSRVRAVALAGSAVLVALVGSGVAVGVAHLSSPPRTISPPHPTAPAAASAPDPRIGTPLPAVTARPSSSRTPTGSQGRPAVQAGSFVSAVQPAERRSPPGHGRARKHGAKRDHGRKR